MRNLLNLLFFIEIKPFDYNILRYPAKIGPNIDIIIPHLIQDGGYIIAIYYFFFGIFIVI